MTEAEETSHLRYRLNQEIADRVKLERELRAELEAARKKAGLLEHALKRIIRQTGIVAPPYERARDIADEALTEAGVTERFT